MIFKTWYTPFDIYVIYKLNIDWNIDETYQNYMETYWNYTNRNIFCEPKLCKSFRFGKCSL